MEALTVAVGWQAVTPKLPPGFSRDLRRRSESSQYLLALSKAATQLGVTVGHGISIDGTVNKVRDIVNNTQVSRQLRQRRLSMSSKPHRARQAERDAMKTMPSIVCPESLNPAARFLIQKV